jgi:hypothetical protein
MDLASRKINRLNNYGSIVEKQWNGLEHQYAYIKSHAYVIMPNHFHAVVEMTGHDLSLQDKTFIKSCWGI